MGVASGPKNFSYAASKREAPYTTSMSTPFFKILATPLNKENKRSRVLTQQVEAGWRLIRGQHFCQFRLTSDLDGSSANLVLAAFYKTVWAQTYERKLLFMHFGKIITSVLSDEGKSCAKLDDSRSSLR